MKTVKDLKLKDKKKLAELSEADMKKEIATASKNAYVLQTKLAANELKQTHLVKHARKYIAQLKTVAKNKGFTLK